MTEVVVAQQVNHLMVIEFGAVQQHADVGIQLIDSAIGLDAYIIFAHTVAAHQRRLSGIAGAGINFTFHSVVFD